MSENEELKDSFQDIIDEMRKKRSFEYQRLDADGNPIPCLACGLEYPNHTHGCAYARLAEHQTKQE